MHISGWCREPHDANYNYFMCAETWNKKRTKNPLCSLVSNAVSSVTSIKKENRKNITFMTTLAPQNKIFENWYFSLIHLYMWYLDYFFHYCAIRISMSDLFAILLVDTACGLERYYTTNQFCNQSEIASDSAEYAMSMPMCRKNAAKN